MTQDQKDTFISMMQLGLAMGLHHPYECYLNQIRCLSNYLPYEEIPLQEQKIVDSMIAFMKGTASCPEEEEWLKTLDAKKLAHRIDDWYAYQRKMFRKIK